MSGTTELLAELYAKSETTDGMELRVKEGWVIVGRHRDWEHYWAHIESVGGCWSAACAEIFNTYEEARAHACGLALVGYGFLGNTCKV